ncbi:MAG: B12-binding domain-containing radical SAM protein [Anaerolineae bacterium]
MSAAPKLLLINPALRPASHGRAGVAGLATMEPLALAYVAGVTPAHWDVRVCDELYEPLPAGYAPSLVAMTSLTPTAPRAYEIAAAYRARGIPVVMGGMHATLCPDEAQSYVDTVFRGECERVWPQLIADFEAGRLASRYEGGAPDLAGLPEPRRDVLRRRYRVSLISTSRGCRYRCEFCALWRFEGGRFRTRPVEDVLNELSHLPGNIVTLFTDDNVYIDRDHTLALARGILERGLRRRYAVQASLDIADDDELLAALKASGCFTVLVGLESLSEETLRRMRKGVNLAVGVEQYRDKIARLHAHGLMVAATFILGSDGDGADVFERTADFVLRAGVDLAHFGLLIPTPGTDVFSRLSREGRLLIGDFPADYALLDLNRAVFRPQAMSPAEAEAGLRLATKRISDWPVALRRAWRTWRETGEFMAAAVSLTWTRTGLRERVLG